jgi:hypothetical protein
MRAAKAMTGPDGKPKEWRALHDKVLVKNGHVQRLKSTARSHANALDDLTQSANVAAGEQTQQIARLGEAIGAFVEISPSLAPHLLAAAYDDELEHLEPAVRQAVPKVSDPVALEMPTPDALTLRLRPSQRP